MTIDMDYYRKINELFGTIDKKDYLQKQAIKSINKTNDSVLSTFEILINSNYAENIIADGISTKCIFDYSKTSQDTKTELAFYTKEMWIEVGITSVGSVVKYTDKVSLIENTYIVVSKQEHIDGYDVCYIQRCNNTLQFYDSSSILHSIPCIISKGSISLDEQKIISTLDSEIAVQISDTDITRQIEMNYIFKLGLRSWQVTNIDDITVNGLLILRMVYNETEPPVHIFGITIQNSDATLYVGNTISLNIICTDNEVQVLSPTLIYLSSNIEVATVANGVITCISEGTAIISAIYNGISDSINLTVQNEMIADNYIVDIVGAKTVILNSTITLNVSVFNNGVTDITKSVVWTLSNQDLSSNIYISIISQNGSSITLKATSNSAYINKYVVIKANKSDDNLVYDEHLLQIKSLF